MDGFEKQMKYGLYIALFLLLLFSGCEKVIDVDLNEADPKVVIEANLSNTPNLAEVKVTQTSSYFDNSAQKNITGATVSVENEAGKKFMFTESAPGIYKSSQTFLRFDQSYKLSVIVDNVDYSSRSKINFPVKIDSLTYSYDEGFAFIDEGYYVTMYFLDPPGKRNYYRVKIFKNGNYKNETESLILFDDKFFDGKYIRFLLRQRVYKPGQEAKVELISLEREAYEYLISFRDLTNVNPGSAAPSNPPSFFTNGALGYFSAWSSDTKKVVIPE